MKRTFRCETHGHYLDSPGRARSLPKAILTVTLDIDAERSDAECLMLAQMMLAGGNVGEAVSCVRVYDPPAEFGEPGAVEANQAPA